MALGCSVTDVTEFQILRSQSFTITDLDRRVKNLAADQNLPTMVLSEQANPNNSHGKKYRYISEGFAGGGCDGDSGGAVNGSPFRPRNP